MIENSYVTVTSDGKSVTVKFWEDGKLREGPATFPARYASFASIAQYIHTQFNTRRLTTSWLAQIQGLLGSPWPKKGFRIDWSSLPVHATDILQKPA